MNILKEIAQGLSDAMKDVSKIISNPEKAGREHAHKDYKGSSPSSLIEGILKDNQHIAKYREESRRNPSNWGAEDSARFREAHKEELKKLLDDNLSS